MLKIPLEKLRKLHNKIQNNLKRWQQIRNLQARVKHQFNHPKRQCLMAHEVNGYKYYVHIWCEGKVEDAGK